MNNIETYANGLKSEKDLKATLEFLCGEDWPASFTIDNGNLNIEFSCFGD